jgi:hypothetical protein
MNSIRLRPTTLLTRSAAVAVASVLALSACGTNEPDTAEEADSSEQEQTEETDSAPLEQETEEAEEAAATEDATTSGEGTEVKVGTEFTDDETGDVITIVSAVRNNPTEYYEASDNPDGEMVYLEVKVVPGKEYGGTISASDFYLDDGGNEVKLCGERRRRGRRGRVRVLRLGSASRGRTHRIRADLHQRDCRFPQGRLRPSRSESHRRGQEGS